MMIPLTSLWKIRKKHRGKKIVFAGGVFDVFHPAHIRTLRNLSLLGEIVVVGIVSDRRVKERKGDKRPILSQSERREIVDAIKYVDYVVQMPVPTKKNPFPTLVILKALKPNLFVSVDRKWLSFKDDIEKTGTELKIVKRIHLTSSTSIIDRILKKYQ